MTSAQRRIHTDAINRLAAFVLGMGLASDWGDVSSVLVVLGVALVWVRPPGSRRSAPENSDHPPS